MTRRSLALIATLLVAWTGLTTAQDQPEPREPERLKKKKPSAVKKESPAQEKSEKKKPEAKPKDEPKETQPTASAPAEEEEVVIERVIKNLKSAQEKLATTELSEATRQIQEDILKDIDALLQQSQQSPDAAPNQGGADNSQDQKDESKDEQRGKSGKSSSPSSSSSRRRLQRRERSVRGQRPSPGKQTANAGNKEPKNAKAGPGNKPMGGKSGDKEGTGDQGNVGGKSREGAPNRASDVYKDIWGHLPESLRAEMDAYFNDRQFMAKYDDLIKSYYRSIAEKGRRPERK